MRKPARNRRSVATLLLAATLGVAGLTARADWPQWRGPQGAAHAPDFKAPATWPKELAKKWEKTVGTGDATPALVGDKLYVFSRENEEEVTRCLDAATGNELWKDHYATQGATGPASGHAGPRSSPAVAEGKVVTLGVRGTLSCLDAASGKVLWRKDEFSAWPRFFTASSPLIVDGLCIAQLGGGTNGAIVAYDLTSGDQKWKSAGNSPGYASLALMTLGDIKLVVGETENKVLALTATDGKTVWETPFTVQGMAYNASTPVVDGQTIYFSGGGRGTRAVKLEKSADGFKGTELWHNEKSSAQFNTPVLKDGHLYGLSTSNELFCIDASNGQTAWTAPLTAGGAAPGARGAGPGGPGARAGRGGGRGGRGMGMAGGGRGGYGSIVDAGDVLLALTPSSDLVVFAPDPKAFTEKAKIKVAPTPTYAYPLPTGNTIYIKDQNSLIAWEVK
jgi:outer membrane protein assembly factor BamB